jgi:hypothetical protein
MTRAELLADAKAALHRLLTGAAAASFTDSNGERVEYQAANIARLQAYVSQLEAELGGPKRPHTIRFATSKGI